MTPVSSIHDRPQTVGTDALLQDRVVSTIHSSGYFNGFSDFYASPDRQESES